MRILDADILAYALYDKSPAHSQAWKTVERGLVGEMELSVTYATILETYNTLFWFYRVRPEKKLLEKLALTLKGLSVVDTAISGVTISLSENIPLGDGFIIGTALKHNKPIIVTNDSHIISSAQKYGLIIENPLTAETRMHLSKWKPEVE